MNGIPQEGRIGVNIEWHGWYETHPEAFDAMIAKFLPATPQQLRTELRERAPDVYRPDDGELLTVTEYLMILAEYEGHATN